MVNQLILEQQLMKDGMRFWHESQSCWPIMETQPTSVFLQELQVSIDQSWKKMEKTRKEGENEHNKQEKCCCSCCAKEQSDLPSAVCGRQHDSCTFRPARVDATDVVHQLSSAFMH